METEVMLSVVTASRNRRESLERLGRSLSLDAKWEWIIGESYDEPLGFIPGARVVRCWPPEGATPAINAACELAQGKYVMLLSDDLEPYPGALQTAVNFMEAHPTVGQGGLYFRQMSHPDHCHISPWHGWMYCNFWIVRREVGKLVGWYDSKLKHYACDNHMSARVLDAGWGVVGIPGACVKDHDPKDEMFKTNNEKWMKDSQGMVEPLWAPHQARLSGIWRANWQPISGGYECPNSEHNR